MKIKEFCKMLIDLASEEPEAFSEYKLVDKAGRPITGIWIERDKKRVVCVQPDTWIDDRPVAYPREG